MKLLSFFPHFKYSVGFTLIELAIVVGIIGILSGVGIVSSLQYNKTQLVDGAAKDFANTLQVAKSRAFTQVKTTQCLNKDLVGYSVDVVSTGSYQLQIQCGDPVETFAIGRLKTLPSGVTMSGSTDPLFLVLKGSVSLGIGITSREYAFTGSGVVRRVTIYDDSRIVTQ